MSRAKAVPRDIPPMKDLTTDNITDNVNLINSQCAYPRLRFIMERLVVHLHSFARETTLSSKEWQAGLDFPVATGKISNELWGEMILLSDTLGLSMLVDSIDHPHSSALTAGTVLGPFHTHDAPVTENGYVLHRDPDTTRLFVLCTVKDSQGHPINDVECDVWECDSKEFYDIQNTDRKGPDGRTVL